MKNKGVDEHADHDSSGEGVPATTPIAVAIPVSNDNSNSASAPPLAILLQSDEEAQASAAAAREQGIATIRNHCEQHLTQNPDSSYVTWVATLHPENAEVSIDPRFLIEGNPWLAVYEEAREDLQKGGGYISGIVATPTSELTPANPHPLQDGQEEASDGHKSGRKFVGFFDFVIGNMLVLMSVTGTFAFEMASSYCYLSYWLCSKIVKNCSPPNMFFCLPLCVAFTIGKTFQLLDASLLFASIIYVESVSVANYLICTIIACSHDQGKAMHQMTRKLPHLIRWAFRQNFENWDPPRAHMRSCSVKPQIQNETSSGAST